MGHKTLLSQYDDIIAFCTNMAAGVAWNNGKEAPRWGVAEIQKMSPDSRPMGARHSNTAANHTDLQSRCGQTCVFAVQAWSNL